jgi:hypothetical protein
MLSGAMPFDLPIQQTMYEKDIFFGACVRHVLDKLFRGT